MLRAFAAADGVLTWRSPAAHRRNQKRRELLSRALREFFRIEEDPITCYSKRRREDVLILHPEVAGQLKRWLATKKLKPDEPLFPISGRVPGGTDRKTSKMMKRDLMAARNKWIDEAKKPAEKMKRLKSDFLSYCNGDGLYADFHSLRHWFITGLARAGSSPKMAQTLARHSDVRLTLGLYTHVTLDDQTAAIESLPAPLAGNDGAKAGGRARRGRGGRRGREDSAA